MPDDTQIDLRQTIAVLQRERDEARAGQSATSEILSVIVRSAADIGPVFEAIVARAASLCEAEFSAVARFGDGLLHLVALNNMSPEESAALHSLFPRPPTGGFAMGRAINDARPVHFADVLAEPDYDPRTLEGLQSVARYRSILGVPILREGRPVGVIGCGRREVRPFTATQIELVKSFADQAAIALENVRLFGELESRNRDLGEALEQQTATAEVLGVINSSPGDLAPVFEAILEKAHALGGASRGTLFLFDGEVFRAAATHGYPEGLPARPRAINVSEDPRLAALVAGERLIHVPDLTQLDDPIARAVAGRGGMRTNLLLPLRKDGAILGVLSCNRPEVRPFGDKQIALLENFAAQAVVAIENARLLNELRERTDDLQESLEYQTATSEVLKVISCSTFDLDPVLENVIETAVRLCRAHMGSIFRLDHGVYRWAVGIGLDPAYREIEMRTPIVLGTGTLVGRTATERCPVQILDAMADPLYAVKDEARLTDARTMLGVPLLREGVPIGVIAMARDRVEPFSDKEVELVSTFADQAVIAIENVRLLTEQREALEQQTATAEVLQVINSSPGNLTPVFEAVAKRAGTLCDADKAFIFHFDGQFLRVAATFNASEELRQFVESNPIRPGRYSGAARCALQRRTIHIPDVMADPDYAYGASGVDPIRTVLAAPMLKGNELLGVILVYHLEVKPFTDKQIALIETFADQAGIAIENARLLTETREALEQQTATAEVLQIINSSPGDLAPVFEAILDKAHKLCGATLGSLFLFDGELFRAAATHGYPEDLAQRLRLGVVLSATSQLLDDNVRWVHNPDLTLVDTPTARAVSGRGGVRTNLMLPLRKDGKLLGAISCNRQEVRPFTDNEIALLQYFAVQAVIAMENARLLTETRESLEYQTAISEVLKVISRSTFDLQPVLDTLSETAARLCQAEMALVSRREGEVYRLAANYGFPGRIRELPAVAPGRS